MKQWTIKRTDLNAGPQPAETANGARKRALRLLEFGDKTKKELTDRLLSEGYTEEETKDAVFYAASFGYIDDIRFACNYIRTRMKEKSRKMLFAELTRKGIDPETFDTAWEETMFEEPQDEGGIIRKIILKKYEAGQELTLKQYRNLCAGLARRGFSYEDIMQELSSMEISYHD